MYRHQYGDNWKCKECGIDYNDAGNTFCTGKPIVKEELKCECGNDTYYNGNAPLHYPKCPKYKEESE